MKTTQVRIGGQESRQRAGQHGVSQRWPATGAGELAGKASISGTTSGRGSHHKVQEAHEQQLHQRQQADEQGS